MIPDYMLVSPSKQWTAEEITSNPANLLLAASHQRLRANREGEKQARELLAAGWTIDFDTICEHSDIDTWQWAWRAPPKRPGKPGRRYGSTNQAVMALRRSKQEK